MSGNRARPAMWGVAAGVLGAVIALAFPPDKASGIARKVTAPCPAMCLQCPLVPDRYAGWSWNGGPHFPGNSDHVHETCNMVDCTGGACEETFLPGPNTAQRLVELVMNGSPSELRAMLKTDPDAVGFHAGRHAVFGGQPHSPRASSRQPNTLV